jgi:hypothetical protein
MLGKLMRPEFHAVAWAARILVNEDDVHEELSENDITGRLACRWPSTTSPFTWLLWICSAFERAD